MTRSQSVLWGSGLVVAVLAGEPSAAVAGEATAGSAELWEVDRTTTAGQVTLEASPARVYAVATDYVNWGSALSDVSEVELLEATVTLGEGATIHSWMPD